ncbi:MAG: YggS family pyridoxal phosphate-dependent enzyme [Flavobacteriales bacterium]|nr:YggS family pyridoxal phosphate-dependent enzyme [Flavobacteriales bacterium]
MCVSKKLKAIQNSMPKTVTLVAVSKTKPKTAIMEAYQSGQRVFGENKVQELVEKAALLPEDINWHMIGHLQRNKVKLIAPFVSLIHGVDSLKLLKEIDKRAAQNKRVINCLLQVHIAKESTKFGFGINEITQVIKDAKQFENIRITGLMGMATFTDNDEQISIEFKSLKDIFDKVRNQDISILSIGMSGDYQIAIEQGSTMVRIGSAIFGAR